MSAYTCAICYAALFVAKLSVERTKKERVALCLNTFFIIL